MIISKKVVAFALISLALTPTAQAYELICSNKLAPNNDQFRTTTQFSKTDFTIEELIELFATGTQSIRPIPTLVCMLPSDHSATRQLFSDMGIEPVVVRSDRGVPVMQENRIRHLKIVQSESEMIECVKGAAPSIGYVERLPPGHRGIACFE